MGFNGVYELIYDTNDANHIYQLLKDPIATGTTTKYIKREQALDSAGDPTTEYYWVLMEGTVEKLRSSVSKCPMDADKWGTATDDWTTTGLEKPGTYNRPIDSARTGGGFLDLEITCSRGKIY